MKEQSLDGGRVTKKVVKIGETVRRPLTKNTNFVNQLLQHLEKVGFDRAPKFLGIDESSTQGRRIKLMLDAYDLKKRQEFIDEIIKIQEKQIQQFKLNVERGLLHWNEAIRWATKCMDWIKMHKDELEKGIG